MASQSQGLPPRQERTQRLAVGARASALERAAQRPPPPHCLRPPPPVRRSRSHAPPQACTRARAADRPISTLGGGGARRSAVPSSCPLAPPARATQAAVCRQTARPSRWGISARFARHAPILFMPSPPRGCQAAAHGQVKGAPLVAPARLLRSASRSGIRAARLHFFHCLLGAAGRPPPAPRAQALPLLRAASLSPPSLSPNSTLCSPRPQPRWRGAALRRRQRRAFLPLFPFPHWRVLICNNSLYGRGAHNWIAGTRARAGGALQRGAQRTQTRLVQITRRGRRGAPAPRHRTDSKAFTRPAARQRAAFDSA
ncbi:MAG: hypothetical protein J3K34DRAFT_250479 [Monoraphidium minutum]|nr:MAG: hypothetical protein J3K34DRAFT_250479 [Monoraphidium minutum]